MKINPIQIISNFVSMKRPSKDEVVYERVAYKKNGEKITLDIDSYSVYNARGVVEKVPHLGKEVDRNA